MSERKKKPYEIGDLDQYLFGQGNHYDLYKKMGAHLVSDGKKKGVYFAVWAPHAEAVSVVGDFNGWEIEANPMEREDLLTEYAAGLNQAICKSLRRGDLFTRYSPNQFLVLLIGIKQEDCEITYNRINGKFREICPSQKVQLRYYVSSIAEIRKEKSGLSFGASGNRWKKK